MRGDGCSAIGSVGATLDSFMDVVVVGGRCVMADNILLGSGHFEAAL